MIRLWKPFDHQNAKVRFLNSFAFCQLRIHITEAKLPSLGIVERISRYKYVLARSLYSAAGKQGVHTRRVGLDRETNKVLLLKHIHEKGSEGAPLKELQQVLPGHNRSQIQVLLRELRKEGRAHHVGNTSATRWFEGSVESLQN